MATIKVGLGPPVMFEPGCAPANLLRLARHIEELGFESVWVPDVQTGDGTAAFEAVTALAAIAGVTSQARLGFATLALPVRPAAWLATQVATLQHVSGDRLLLGIGSGGFPESPFWRALGVPARERGRRTDDTLGALPALLAGRPVRVAGVEVQLGPPATMPPVLVGGNSDVALRRTIERGDGWLPSLIAPDRLAERAAALHARAERAGRARPGITVGGHMFVGTGSEVDAARAAFVRQLVDVHRMAPDEAERVPMPGESPERIAEHFAAYAGAGAERVITGPHATDETEWLRQAEVIAEGVALLR
ncbi:LLM class flavin-dependent oxidoreductase [Actinophytocola sp.]|uniref:LLM class flavin-dependent oxidoreductase n=1 Tax=Actinophytocola sp. TaxID=1872138 RepID=UPI003D6A2EB4